jgi:hypothetical protein
MTRDLYSGTCSSRRVVRAIVVASLSLALMMQTMRLEENTPEADGRDERERRKAEEVKTLDEGTLPNKEERLEEIFERFTRDQTEADQLARSADWKDKSDGTKRRELQDLSEKQRHVAEQ